jgi:flagellar biosynthesis/type III secretory pathway protein FliH
MRDINYSSWSDEELRRALTADDDDVCAILEAAKRFAKQEVYTQEELESAEQTAREQAYDDGYADGHAEGKREDDSR